ncbi:MAG: helix-turn-helix transcriptional regulator [Ruminococcaceae bacterium]|nr:helix-turn-helix transcriptional regulator [Oscillospiraceae bacterium]
MNYYQRIKDLREDHDYKQTDIAKILGTSRQQVGRWENGLQMMGVDKYIILAKFYNVSADYLLGLIDTPRKLREE